jgi:hypothetical protein
MATLPQVAPDSSPRMTYRTTRKFEMRETQFPPEVNEQIKEWLWNQIKTRRQQLDKRHKKLVPEWERIAEGKPREEKKSWPFENCANLVHQVVGEATDDMAARVMGIIWATAPIIIYRYLQKSEDINVTERNSKKQKVLEAFMDYAAYEPNELDLYEKENIWFSYSTKIGTGWLCVVPEERIEPVYVGYEEKRGSKFEDATLYEGPKVINLRDQDCLYDPQCDTPEESDFFSRTCRGLTRRKLQEREFNGQYKKGSVSTILGKPDRYGPSEPVRKEQKNKGVTATEEPHILAEWDIEECYFYWYRNKKKFRLIAWFHYETKTVMNCVFNFIPENQLPVVRTRLSSGEKGMNGRGLADMGKDGQDEISTTKNQRIDATTWGMLGINRISPMNKNIDKNFKIFPGCGLPFGKDEFEHFEVANPAMHAVSQKNEEMMIQQVRERFGIGPAVAGSGAGGPIDKRGRFGSMGTFAVLQDSNTRVAHRTSDFRHSHVKLFGLLTDMYGAMGLGRKGSLFGLDDQLLTEALQDYLERRVRNPIRAATASANREVTKQNQLLLNQALMMFTKEASTMIQAIVNAQAPPFYKKWLIATVKARVRLVQQIIRDFQVSDQPEEYVPNIEFPEEQPEGGEGGATQGGGSPVRIDQVAQYLRGRGVGPGARRAEGVPELGGGPAEASRGAVI